MAAPRVFVLCPDYEPPSGGIRKLYRHADVLNRHDLAASVLHHHDGFRLRWFDHATPVAYVHTTPLGGDDFLVVPEVFGPAIAGMAPGVRKVIFNQNSYLTFQGYALDPHNRNTPYYRADVVAALTVSEDNRPYLAYAFPRLRLVRLRYGIDAELFACHPDKQARIALMPRKNAADVVQVVNLLKQRRALDGYELVPIDGRPEREVARLLGACRFFFSFGHPEGCPLPPLEAMACGCVVVGYHGRGGREYFQPDFSYPVEAGDVVSFARLAEQALRACATDPAPWDEQGRRATAFVRAHYAVAQEEQDILACWRALLTEAGHAPPSGWPHRDPGP